MDQHTRLVPDLCNRKGSHPACEQCPHRAKEEGQCVCACMCLLTALYLHCEGREQCHTYNMYVSCMYANLRNRAHAYIQYTLCSIRDTDNSMCTYVHTVQSIRTYACTALMNSI